MTKVRGWNGRGARRSARMLAAAGGLSAVMALSSGCIGGVGQSMSQRGLLGPAKLDITACVSKQNSPCPSGGASNTFPTATPGTRVQALLGLLIPVGYVPPDALVKPPGPSGDKWFGGVWTRSPSFAEELTRLGVPPAGTFWVGYVSEATDAFDAGATYAGTVDLARPVAADGSPLPAAVSVHVVAGARSVTDAAQADRPVECGIADFTICNDYENSAGFGRVLHDLAILPLPTVTTPRGTTAVVPVTAVFAGDAGPAYTFALTATTSLPATSATANVPTLAPPTDSRTAVSVSVPVPADATPGSYKVTVTAALGSTGESRSATGTLIVTAPGGTPSGGTPSGGAKPAVAFTAARGLTATAARTKGLPVRITTDVATRATVSLSQVRRVRVARRIVSRSVVVARKTVVVLAGTTTVRVKGGGLRPGRVAIRVTGAGFSARGATTLR